MEGQEEEGGVGGVNTVVLRTQREIELSRFNEFVINFLQENGPKVRREGGQDRD